MKSLIARALPAVCLIFVSLLTLAIYWPGLAGGFIYDDMSFIVGNPAIQLSQPQLSDWIAAALSFPAGAHQGRWLGMLSFAANDYFTGLDPFWFKLTNVEIHLFNGALLFLALRALFALWLESSRRLQGAVTFDPGVAAATIAGLWLVLPINLTAVLYASQRLESLSNTFVFLGLWWYLRARIAHWRGEQGAWSLWLSLIVCTGIGVLVKESAVLLPLYTACVEFTITRARDRSMRLNRPVLALYGCLLALPLIGGLVWLAGWVHGPETYGRPFDTMQRLLTESRVLIDYVGWTAVPSLDSLTLYHDDIPISHGLFDPPATAAAIAALAVLLSLALWQRTRRPLFSTGVLWFFSGHLLTATIIPLLLAFEHRNYFPSAGLVLAGASLVTLEGPLRKNSARIGLAGALLAFYAFTTWMRAEEWSDPMRLSMSEASKRPASPAAQYERATMMIETSRTGGQGRLLEDALLSLRENRHLPNAGINFEQLLITTAATLGQPAEPSLWDSLIAKLLARPPSMADAKALANLNGCFLSHLCKEELPRLGKAYETALSFPGAPPALLSAHAEFAWYLLDDRSMAERDIREAVRRAPLDFASRRNLAILLLATGQLDEAHAEIVKLQQANPFGIYDKMIAPLQTALQKRRDTAP